MALRSTYVQTYHLYGSVRLNYVEVSNWSPDLVAYAAKVYFSLRVLVCSILWDLLHAELTLGPKLREHPVFSLDFASLVAAGKRGMLNPEVTFQALGRVTPTWASLAKIHGHFWIQQMDNPPAESGSVGHLAKLDRWGSKPSPRKGQWLCWIVKSSPYLPSQGICYRAKGLYYFIKLSPCVMVFLCLSYSDSNWTW